MKDTISRLSVSCKPGAILNQNFANVIALDFKHREYYVNENGSSQVRTVEENKFTFKFGAGIYGVDGVVNVPNCGTVPFPMPGIGYGFYVAHKKDRLGTTGREGQAVKVERDVRSGVYPVLFELTYADQHTESNASAADTTEFQLVHKPEPDALPPRGEEPKRTPLKPSTRIKIP